MLKKNLKLIFLTTFITGLCLIIFFTKLFSNTTEMNSNDLEVSEKIDFSSSHSAFPDVKKITLWLNTQSLKNIKNGASLPTWQDSSQNKITLEVLSAAKEPTVKLNAVNGYASVVFSGTSYFESFNILGSDLIRSDNGTIAIVFKPSEDLNGIAELFGWGDCSEFRWLAHISPDIINFHFGKPSFHADSVSIITELERNNFNILILNKDMQNSLIELNGRRISKFANNGKLNVDQRFTLTIGSSSCGHHFLGEIAEFIVLKDLQEAERYNLTQAIADKYKIKIN